MSGPRFGSRGKVTKRDLAAHTLRHVPRAQPGITELMAGGPAVPLEAAPKVGRNDPCPCGSGGKRKKCEPRHTLPDSGLTDVGS